jgi:hypothetical protein
MNMTDAKTKSTGNESRRRFLQLATFGAGAVALSSLLVGKARAADLPHLTLDDPTAKALGYVEDASTVDASKYATHKPGQNCMGCNFYQGAAGTAYAACTLFPGKAVNAKGWCSGFAAKPA